MKKYIKKLICRLIKMRTEEKFGYSIGAILGVMVCILVFLSIDKVHVTTSDYSVLQKQIVSICEDPYLLFETDCDINIKDDLIKVTVENEEYKMTGIYDENFKLLSIDGEEKSIFWLIALIISVVIGFFSYIFFTHLCTALIYILEIFLILLPRKL